MTGRTSAGEVHWHNPRGMDHREQCSEVPCHPLVAISGSLGERLEGGRGGEKRRLGGLCRTQCSQTRGVRVLPRALLKYPGGSPYEKFWAYRSSRICPRQREQKRQADDSMKAWVMPNKSGQTPKRSLLGGQAELGHSPPPGVLRLFVARL